MGKTLNAAVAASLMLAPSCSRGEGEADFVQMRPTQESYEVVVFAEDEQFADLGYLAGFYACNGVDLEVVTAESAEEYDIDVAWGGLPSEYQLQFLDNLNTILLVYALETADLGYENWLPVYERMHEQYMKDLDGLCVSVAQDQMI